MDRMSMYDYSFICLSIHYTLCKGLNEQGPLELNQLKMLFAFANMVGNTSNVRDLNI